MAGAISSFARAPVSILLVLLIPSSLLLRRQPNLVDPLHPPKSYYLGYLVPFSYYNIKHLILGLECIISFNSTNRLDLLYHTFLQLCHPHFLFLPLILSKQQSGTANHYFLCTCALHKHLYSGFLSHALLELLSSLRAGMAQLKIKYL